jgi:hypothetical protein
MLVKSILKGRTCPKRTRPTQWPSTRRRALKAVFEGDVENAFRIYAGAVYRQHNPLIEDGMEGLRKFVAWILANHPDAHGEITMHELLGRFGCAIVLGSGPGTATMKGRRSNVKAHDGHRDIVVGRWCVRFWNSSGI